MNLPGAARHRWTFLANLLVFGSLGALYADGQATTSPGERDPGVLTGLDVLVRDNFQPLAGRKIGLITNHTGVDRDGRSIIELLVKAPDVKLVALFSPEHGLKGALDEKVGDTTDALSGLKVYSLYGKTSRPTPEMLEGVDTLVYDIYDIGTRFYTYPATLGYAMEEAGKRGIRVVVLDRPNPITGTRVFGPLNDRDGQFTAYHTVPLVHGMTIGELAQMFNTERKLNVDLQVIKMEGWRRSLWYDDTLLPWISPSPNMRSLTEATLYPAIGMLEACNLSVGRGTDTPFERIGAPWLDGRQLALRLNSLGLKGVRDPTSGYRCFRRSVLESIHLETLTAPGPAIVTEILYRCRKFRIKEIPIHFEDRRIGLSKMSVRVKVQGALDVLRIWRRHHAVTRRESESPDLELNARG